MQAPLTQTTHRHHSHTHTHTQPCVEVGPLRRTNAATEQPAIRKNITLKKSATSIRSVHHKRGNRPPFLPHSVPTTTFSRSVRYYCPRVPQSRLYKHSQCSGCSLHQASKKAGLKKKKRSLTLVYRQNVPREARGSSPLRVLCGQVQSAAASPWVYENSSATAGSEMSACSQVRSAFCRRHFAAATTVCGICTAHGRSYAMPLFACVSACRSGMMGRKNTWCPTQKGGGGGTHNLGSKKCLVKPPIFST